MSNSTGNYCQPVSKILTKAQSTTVLAAPVATSLILTATNVVSGGFSANMMMCLFATECLANMQYLNINHSDIAITIYSGMSSSLFPNWIVDYDYLNQSLLTFNWGIFEDNQISSLYLDNFGDALTQMLFYFGIYALVALFTIRCQKERMLFSWIGKIHIIAFSFFGSTLFGAIQGQLLFSTIQILRMDLSSDKYSQLSLVTAYLTLALFLGFLTGGFFRLQSIWIAQKKKRSNMVQTNLDDREASLQDEWLEKKYEFMHGDFINEKQNQFLFLYWILGFNGLYILLIFWLQNSPVLQCLSITILLIAVMMLPIIIRPFKRKMTAFIHYLNFGCVLVVALLNLILAIADTMETEVPNVQIQGWAVVSVIILNAATNIILSLGLMIKELVKKRKRVEEVKPREEATTHVEVMNMPPIELRSQQIKPLPRINLPNDEQNYSSEILKNDLNLESSIPVPIIHNNDVIDLNQSMQKPGASKIKIVSKPRIRDNKIFSIK